MGVDQAGAFRAGVAELRIWLQSGLGTAAGPVLAIAQLSYHSSSLIARI